MASALLRDRLSWPCIQLPPKRGREREREGEIVKGKIKEERRVALIVAGVFLYHVWSKLILAGIGQWYNRSRVQKHG